ncbi:MAG: ZIP family metal transporter [Flavobacteriales bacterium]|jgi:zinc transporter ZupT|nr:ZIP family metal transporter [Flavobacteriales bacterium]
MSNWSIILALFLVVMATGVVTYIFQDLFRGIKHYLTTVGVAFVLSLICVHILPEVFHSHVSNIGAYLLLGFVFQIFLELFSKGIEHGHVHQHGEEKHYSINKTLVSMFFGLCVHSLIEGIPLFIIDTADLHAGHGHSHSVVHATEGFSTVLFWAIIGHKIPVAVVLMLFLIQSQLKKSTIIWLFILFASMSPIGGIIGLSIDNTDIVNDLSSILLAVTTGMLIHVTTLLVFEEYHNQKEKIKNIVLIIIGLVLGIFVFV